MAQLIGGGALLAGLYFTYRTVEAAQRTLELSREGHVTDRYYKAVEQLGSANVGVRVGALYALERLSLDSERDYQTVVDVVVNFVREVALKPTDGQHRDHCPPDLQAALTVLGRRKKGWGGQELRLHNLDLSHAELHGNFDHADMSGSLLVKANLWHGSFVSASFTDAVLRTANMIQADLLGADLEGSTLDGALFNRSPIPSRGTSETDSATSVFFVRIYPTGNRLYDLNVSNSSMVQTELRGCDLSRVEGLTRQQLNEAITDENTLLPDYLKAGTVVEGQSKLRKDENNT